MSNLTEEMILEPLVGPSGSPLRDAWKPVDTDPESGMGQVNTESYYYRYVRKCWQYLHGRRFFTTTKGNVGLGLKDIEAGDLICIVYGCHKPLIVRPHGDVFVAVGECYVQGTMFGEAMEGVKSGKYEERSFSFE